MTGLPAPINGTETYLRAVHDRLGDTNTLLGQILDRLSEPAREELSDVVELREPHLSAGAAEPAELGAGEGRPAEPDTIVDLAEPQNPTTPARPARRRAPARKTREA